MNDGKFAKDLPWSNIWRADHISGFPLTLEKLESLEKWEKFFQSGKSQGILEFHQKVREKSGNFLSVREN